MTRCARKGSEMARPDGGSSHNTISEKRGRKKIKPLGARIGARESGRGRCLVNRRFADQSLKVTIRSRERPGTTVIEARETKFAFMTDDRRVGRNTVE